MRARLHHPRSRRSAFTLVELLVVIAILALLIAILLPSLRGARRSAKGVVCMSNMRQVGIAVQMYADENAGAVAAPLHITGQDAVPWFSLLSKYILIPKVSRCPLDRSTNWESDPFHPTLGLRTTSFITNDRIAPTAAPPITKLAQVRKPMTKIFMAESKDTLIGDHFHPLSWTFFLTTPQEELALTRHGGRSHFLFVDGHLERLSFDKTWTRDGLVDRYDPAR